MSKRVLVTGASGLLGGAIVHQLARQGFSLTLHYFQNQNSARDLESQLKGMGMDAHCICFDVTNRSETRRVLESEIEKNGHFYGLVCNAGIYRDNAFPSLSEEDWDRVLSVNLNGFFNVTQPLVMPMIRAKNSGRIVVLSSVSGLVGNRGQVNYSAAKAGLIGAVKALALELAKRKITVNCVAPGLIRSEKIEPEVYKQAMSMIPLQRAGEPAEVAAMVGFLFSDEAAYITRQVISVNGGMI